MKIAKRAIVHWLLSMVSMDARSDRLFALSPDTPAVGVTALKADVLRPMDVVAVAVAVFSAANRSAISSKRLRSTVPGVATEAVVVAHVGGDVVFGAVSTFMTTSSPTSMGLGVLMPLCLPLSSSAILAGVLGGESVEVPREDLSWLTKVAESPKPKSKQVWLSASMFSRTSMIILSPLPPEPAEVVSKPD